MNYESLVAATRAVTTTFDDIPADPVEVTIDEGGGADEIERRYLRHGFAIMEVKRTTVDEGVHRSLTHLLGLGPVFVPPLYAQQGQEPSEVSVISAAYNADKPNGNHPSFGRTVGQALHCDGTLQPIGFVKATLMSCVNPAEHGGINILFNSSATYSKLLSDDPEAAFSLAEASALARRATINGSSEVTLGPAFTVEEDRLVCRYCVTETDSWQFDVVGDGAALRRAVSYFAAAASPGSQFFLELKLAPNQGIVFDNTRISHGRTSYHDSPTNKRCMLRTLHLAHPSSDGVRGVGANEPAGAAR